MRITGLYIYPIKSCQGVSLEVAEVERAGLRHDRRLMVVDGDGRFLTQRTHPRLGSVRTALREAGVEASSSNTKVLIPYPPEALVEGDPTLEVQVWGDRVRALRHAEGSAFFAELLEIPDASLVALPSREARSLSPTYGAPEDRVGFADAFPILLLGDASVRDLGERAGQPFDMRRFRPNVTFEGPAYAEDTLARFRVGALHFRGPKRCDRCVMTTLDPDTQAGGKEPLKTLSSYRRGDDGKVYLGMNVIPASSGTLAVGQTIVAL